MTHSIMFLTLAAADGGGFDAFLHRWLLPAGCTTGSPLTYVLVTIIGFLMIATSKGGFGGLAVAAAPLLMTVMDATTALGLMLPLMLLCDVMTMPYYPRERVWRPIIRIAPWTTTGLIIGWLLLSRITATTVPWLNFSMGVLAVAFAALELVRWAVVRRTQSGAVTKPWQPGFLVSLPFGISAGICTMLAHAAGAITTIYFLPQQLEPPVFVGTTNRYYLIFNAAKIPFYVHLGLITGHTLQRSLWLLPIAFLGVWAGWYLNSRVSQRGFRFILVALLLATGVLLVQRNAWVVWPS